MHSLLNLKRTAILALAAMTPFAVPAQTTPPPAHSLSWCSAPAANPDWARQPILLVLEEVRDPAGVKSKTTPLPPSHLAELLGAVRNQFRAATTPAGSSDEVAPALLAADARYHVAALWGDITFQLRGNGTVDSIVLRDVRDSTLFNELVAALRAVSNRARSRRLARRRTSAR